MASGAGMSWAKDHLLPNRAPRALLVTEQARCHFPGPGDSVPMAGAMDGREEAVPDDEEVVRRIRAGEAVLFDVLMRRYNQRLFRVARAILKDEDEAEDVMQQAYVNAYTHLHQFEERARFGTWLTRIAFH